MFSIGGIPVSFRVHWKAAKDGDTSFAYLSDFKTVLESETGGFHSSGNFLFPGNISDASFRDSWILLYSM